jgi:hypothetical protein
MRDASKLAWRGSLEIRGSRVDDRRRDAASVRQAGNAEADGLGVPGQVRLVAA